MVGTAQAYGFVRSPATSLWDCVLTVNDRGGSRTRDLRIKRTCPARAHSCDSCSLSTARPNRRTSRAEYHKLSRVVPSASPTVGPTVSWLAPVSLDRVGIPVSLTLAGFALREPPSAEAFPRSFRLQLPECPVDGTAQRVVAQGEHHAALQIRTFQRD